ncbi:hypothetical protein WICPIJ_008079 [Wickerhamomyces pijperi]|uniref:Uncharacterized protein n=1 Tax=Wickerhamomyces pijperi TaxID=599730 RepID=A0A9P8TJ90_WICPI|nr:hypothetical protein WICPIJ_008079 [Wickerhamomyces pijperi]
MFKVLTLESMVSIGAVVVDVTWLGQSNNWVNQDVGVLVSCGSHSQFSVGSVHWVSCLEGNNSGPLTVNKLVSQLVWSLSDVCVVVVDWQLDGLQATTDIDVTLGFVQVDNGWVLWITAKDQVSLLLLIWNVDRLNGQNSQRVTIVIL